MTFPGKFTDHLIADKLDRVSLSFLVDGLEIRHGGVAANIAFGMGCLGLQPLLVGAVGQTSRTTALAGRPRRDTSGVLESKLHTPPGSSAPPTRTATRSRRSTPARWVRRGHLDRAAGRAGGVDLVLIGADDPEAMFRHTAECRTRVSRSRPTRRSSCRDGHEQTRSLVDGAAYLFSNEYEPALIEQKTGWTADMPAASRSRSPRSARRARASPRPASRRSRCPPSPAPGARPDRRRRRLPCGLPGRGGLGPVPRAGGPARLPGGRPPWRPWAPRSTNSRPDALTDRLATAYGEEAAAEVAAYLPVN